RQRQLAEPQALDKGARLLFAGAGGQILAAYLLQHGGKRGRFQPKSRASAQAEGLSKQRGLPRPRRTLGCRFHRCIGCYLKFHDCTARANLLTASPPQSYDCQLIVTALSNNL